MRGVVKKRPGCAPAQVASLQTKARKTLPQGTVMQEVINMMLCKLSEKELARAAEVVQKMRDIKVVSLCSGSELQECPLGKD